MSLLCSVNDAVNVLPCATWSYLNGRPCLTCAAFAGRRWFSGRRQTTDLAVRHSEASSDHHSGVARSTGLPACAVDTRTSLFDSEVIFLRRLAPVLSGLSATERPTAQRPQLGHRSPEISSRPSTSSSLWEGEGETAETVSSLSRARDPGAVLGEQLPARRGQPASRCRATLACIAGTSRSYPGRSTPASA